MGICDFISTQMYICKGNWFTMPGPCYMYVQGSGWGSCAMLNGRHFLCIYMWTGLGNDMDLVTFYFYF